MEWTGDYSDAKLIERAVRNAGNATQRSLPRWACVRAAFGLGSTVSQALCERFGVSPDDEIKPNVCEQCAALADDEEEETRL